MSRYKTFDSTGIATAGRLYAGDLNAIQDLYADLYNLTQNHGVASLALGEAGLQLLRYGAGEARLSGHMRVDGILRGLGGLFVGAYTTTQRDAIASGSRPFTLLIFNTTTNQFEFNGGSDASPAWQPITPAIGTGTITSAMIADGTIVNVDIATAAAIAYSKLALNNSILNADIAAAAAIVYSKLSLANSIVNSDIAAAAAIAYSKLALSNSIVHGDIAAANKDGVAGTPSMRTLGTGSQQAAAGNDSRLSDQRTPLDNSVSTPKLQDNAATFAKMGVKVASGDFIAGFGGGAVAQHAGVIGAGTTDAWGPISFGVTFPSAPRVLLTRIYDNVNTGGGNSLPVISGEGYDISTTQFYVTWNGGGAGRFHWIAVV